MIEPDMMGILPVCVNPVGHDGIGYDGQLVS